MSNSQMIVKLTSPTGVLYKCQKSFRINKKREPENQQDVRVSDIFKKDILFAAKVLNGNAFKIYMYLISNQDSYVGGLSKTDIMNQLQMSEKGYRNSLDELQEKGFLVKTSSRAEDCHGEQAPLCEFYAIPR